MDRQMWKRLLERYGQRVTVYRAGLAEEVKAFFQPVSERAAGETITALGVAPAGKYLYLGPAELDPEEVEELAWNGRFFRLIRVRAVPAGEEIAYRWALAEELDGRSGT